MKKYPEEANDAKNQANEGEVPYQSKEAAEEARLKRHMYMSDMDKLKAFTRMLIRNATYKKAIVTHQK